MPVLSYNLWLWRLTLYGRVEVEARPGGAAALAAQVAALEKAAGCRFLEGNTPGRRIMAHLREPLRVSYRPAVLYGLTEMLSVAKRLSLARRGERLCGWLVVGWGRLSCWLGPLVMDSVDS